MGNCGGLQTECVNTVMLFQKKKKANIVLKYIHRIVNIRCISETFSEARSNLFAFWFYP